MNIKAHCSIIGENGYNNHSRNFFSALNNLHNVKIRNFTVGKSWKGLNNIPHEGEQYLTDDHKSMLFEQILWVDENMCENRSYPIYSYDDKFIQHVNITLEPMNHHLFYDNHIGKVNIGYNVWETTRYPDSFFNLIKKYDQFWVASNWHKNCLIEQGYDSLRVKVVPEGVDVNTFFPEKTSHELTSDGRFKFFLAGRWDYRKSIKEIIETFLKTFDKDEPVDLIVSVDNPFSNDGLKTTEERLEHYGFTDNRIKVLHFPPREEYIRLLKSCDAFVSYARSEAWNFDTVSNNRNYCSVLFTRIQVKVPPWR